jgi:hypothetical protein
MSLTNLNFENEIDVRARKALISDLWTRDSGGEFFKVTPGGGSTILPSYLKSNSVEISGVSNNKTVLDENSVDVNDLSAGTGTSLTPTSLTFGDSGGNVTFTKSSADTANKLASGIAATQNTVLGDGRTLLVWNSPTNGIIRTNNMKLIKNSAEYSTLEPSALAVVNNSLGSSCTISPSKFVSTDASKNLLILGSSNVIYGQATTPSGNVLDTNATYTSLTKQGLNIKEAALPTAVLARDDVIVANKLATVSKVFGPSAAYEMVIYNPTTKAFGYATTPSSAPTLPKTYYKSVTTNDFPSMNDSFTAFLTAREVKTYALNSGDRLIFDFGATPYVKFETWYLVGLALENPGFKSLIKASHVPYRQTDVGTTVQCCYVGGLGFGGGGFTVQPYHIAFKISQAGKNNAQDFTGYIEFHKLLHDSSTADTITPT